MAKPNPMTVARYEGPGRIKLTAVTLPKLTPTQVLVKVHASSVCGTDVRIFRGETDVRPPRVLGHDFAGTVIETGVRARMVSKGDRVAVSPVGHCGRCKFCLLGIDTMCTEGAWHGFEKDGGFAQFVAVDRMNVLRLPGKVSLDQAAMLEPFVVALRCFDRVHLKPQDWICIFGQGAIGLAVTSVARSSSLRVIAIDPDKGRRVAASRLGAAACFADISPFSLQRIFKLTRGEGVAVSVEASGSQRAVDRSRDVVRSDGTVLLVGSGVGLRGPLINTAGKELAYVEVELGPLRLYKKAIQLIARGEIDPLDLRPSRISLEELPGIMKKLSDEDIRVVKVLVFPNKLSLSR